MRRSSASSLIWINPHFRRPVGDRKVGRFGWTFAPSDKVMQIENDYDKEVYNGYIEDIDDIKLNAGEMTGRCSQRLSGAMSYVHRGASGVPVPEKEGDRPAPQKWLSDFEILLKRVQADRFTDGEPLHPTTAQLASVAKDREPTSHRIYSLTDISSRLALGSKLGTPRRVSNFVQTRLVSEAQALRDCDSRDGGYQCRSSLSYGNMQIACCHRNVSCRLYTPFGAIDEPTIEGCTSSSFCGDIH